LELQLLRLECLVALELNLLLSQLIECLAVLDAQAIDLFVELLFLLSRFNSRLCQLLLLLAQLLHDRLLLVLQGCNLALLAGQVGSQLLNLCNQLAALLVELFDLLLELSGRRSLYLVEGLLGLGQVGLEGFDLLLPHRVLVIELVDHIVGLALLVRRLVLQHLQVVLVALLLLADLLLVVLDGRVVTLLGTLSLFLKAALETITFNFKEALELLKLLLRLLLHLPHCILKLPGLLVQLPLQFEIPLFCAALVLINQPCLLRLELLDLLDRACAHFLRSGQLLSERLRFVDGVIDLGFEGKLHLGIALLEGIDMLDEALALGVILGLEFMVLVRMQLLDILELLGGLLLAND